VKLPDAWFRFVYRHGFRLARLVWSIHPPRHRGALVMLWCDECVLLVRTSYQDVWMAPGGGVGAQEEPLDAAVREVREELGLQVDRADLSLALEVEHLWNSRRDRVWFFERVLPSRPHVTLDGRELIEARWFDPASARALDTSPHIRDYLAWRVRR
jgi:8-oxo-dGTP pyrophosphatase MutT (NUDIX family)